MTEKGESCLPCSAEEERSVIEELMETAKSNLREGNLYYLVSTKWWRNWQEYTRQDASDFPNDGSANSQHSNRTPQKIRRRPGQIDNSDLVDCGFEGDNNELDLVRTLAEGCDYVLVPQDVWKKLVEWYSGGPPLPRKLISHGSVFNKSFSVEIYPLRLKVIDQWNNTLSFIQISRKATVRELYDRVCTLSNLEQGKICLWDYFNQRKHSLLDEFDKTLEYIHLETDEEILLEVDGSWPSHSSMDSTGNSLALVPIEPSTASMTIAGVPALCHEYSSEYDPDLLSSSLRDAEDDGLVSTCAQIDTVGLTGLWNIGNTCFMNSAIQCLAHTPPLVEYFLQDYSEDINEVNLLGSRGELAVAFGDLLRKLWSSGRTPISPHAFKGKLDQFAPQFSGYNQHDSQELLAFLLDGLHEDLNRVKDKPYIVSNDSIGCPDEEVADECWRNHKARNDSIIVDVCQGQYKSTVVCPVCSKVSVTFDLFMYLSLPLPSTATRTMTVAVFYGNGRSLHVPITVTVLKHGCCKDLIQALSTECCLKTDETILLAEIYNHKIFRYLEDPFDPLSDIKDDEYIVAYILPKTHEKLSRLEILHWKERSTGGLSGNGYVGTPLVTCLAEGTVTGADIEAVVNAVLAPLLRRKEILPVDSIKIAKENCSVLRMGANRLPVNSDPCLMCDSHLVTDREVDGQLNKKPSFCLWLLDIYRGLRTPLENVSLISSDKIIHVLLDWSDGILDSCDINFLGDLPEVLKSGYMVKKTRQEAISLFSCLEAFLKEEPLGPDDMWYCPTCKEHRQATKKLDLWRMPDILVVHLKRFSYSRYMNKKLDDFVDFPLSNLDLSQYIIHKDVNQSRTYELYAVSNHYGNLDGGHYSAYVKLLKNNRWYHFDDSLVSPATEDAIKNTAAYLLFYQRTFEVEMGNGDPSGA